ncbi:branched-chain amino acid transport system II carrier protein [Ignatzschineria indica]|uniref:Branched-chain amino acid transport system carrier protein n=1 Tax=Ignatzschineria indica TaxID=472583 RepID=A0A2U2AJB2_9GAMM|nr:branched-chain amino acid transport system II carrier protein [Ignatzschineria indica]PWD82742.1 branched-chain amino acid transport system II carrier protein [Ignatzschineria indica]
MKNNKLSLASYITVGSMLFGLFFGAGNLIFPVHMGQEAGASTLMATIGFILTGVGLPFLGVVAIGFSKSNGLYDLASRITPAYGLFFTMVLYLTIGPFFALPRTATVSFEIGLTPFLGEDQYTIALLIFTILFFLLAWILSLNPSNIMMWIGKVLNPLFLLFLAFLIISAFIKPMGEIEPLAIQPAYQGSPFFKGFTEGYNTMDVLASLAFGIIVVNAIKSFGVTNTTDIAKDTFKSGIISLILMSVIYGCLAYIGAMSLNAYPLSENGGIALAQIATYYFGAYGSILLAIIITVACLKTAIGLICACAEMFNQLFPKISYRTFVHLFSLISMLIANVGLTAIISISIPVLMFLYPLAITLVFLAFASPLFHHKKIVYQFTIGFTFIIAVVEGLKASSEVISQNPIIFSITSFFDNLLPLSDVNMGWILPAIAGFVIGWIVSLIKGLPSK